jgi:hypothetical protein
MVFVSNRIAACLTNMLPEDVNDELVYSDPIKTYQNIFIKVNNWGQFEQPDIQRNNKSEERNMATAPNFVANFERTLERKSRLVPDVRCFLDLSVCRSI